MKDISAPQIFEHQSPGLSAFTPCTFDEGYVQPNVTLNIAVFSDRL
jgi:hypothetical protein